MELRVLGCAGGSALGKLLSGYLIDDVLAVDAGSLSTALTLDEQRRIQALLLTHSHLDHVLTLPFFAVHRYAEDVPSCPVHASAATIDAVGQHLFNDQIWLELDQLEIDGRPLITWEPMEPGEHADVIGYDVRAVALTHAVPSQAYCIERDGTALIVCGDTTTTDALWAFANERPAVRAIVIECSWPDSLRWVAEAGGHMTPQLLIEDLDKLRTDARILVTHHKPGYEDELRAALDACGDPRLRFLDEGQTLTIS